MLYQRFSQWENGPFVYGMEELAPVLEYLKQIDKINQPFIDLSKVNIILKAKPL